MICSDLGRDGEGGGEAVHSLVVLSTQVEEDPQATLQLGVHPRRVGVSGSEEHGLDLREQGPGGRTKDTGSYSFWWQLGSVTYYSVPYNIRIYQLVIKPRQLFQNCVVKEKG